MYLIFSWKGNIKRSDADFSRLVLEVVRVIPIEPRRVDFSNTVYDNRGSCSGHGYCVGKSGLRCGQTPPAHDGTQYVHSSNGGADPGDCS